VLGVATAKRYAPTCAVRYWETDAWPPTLCSCQNAPLPPKRPLACRPHLPALLPPMLEHVAGGLTARYAALRPGELPPESLAQYFLDLAWLDGVISAAGESGGPCCREWFGGIARGHGAGLLPWQGQRCRAPPRMSAQRTARTSASLEGAGPVLHSTAVA
jgi:hypothetical protein